MAAIPAPIGEQIVVSVEKALNDTKLSVGVNYHHAPDLVVRVSGISPKWFENPEFQMAYFIVVPEERNEVFTSFQHLAFMELFVVGAKAGKWTVDPRAAQSKPPIRETVQQYVLADIKRSMLVDFRRSDPSGNTLAFNTDLTAVKMAFTAWANFAIVSTRWEIEYRWPRERP